MGRAGGIMPAVMNGANERAVRLFLQKRISFLDIEKLIFETVREAVNIEDTTVNDIIESDRWAQKHVLDLVEGSL